MRLSEAAELRFESSGARAAVLSSSRGRYIIQAESNASGKSDIAYTLTSVINPARGKLSTRAGGINNALDFTKHFGKGPIAILGEEYKVPVSKMAFPMNDRQFFYAQYEYDGETINKKLNNLDDLLVFEVSSLYAVDDVPIDAEAVKSMTLFYYNAASQESTELTKMEFKIVTEEDLRVLGSEDTEELTLWINDLYGKCSPEAVEKAMAQLK